MIFNQLIQYFDRYKLLYKSQYGFRKNHCTELAALEFKDKINIFADYTTLIVDLNVYNKTIINREIKKLSLWLKLNNLSINVNKSKCIVFRQPQKNRHSRI